LNKKFFLFCGIAASMVYIAGDITAALQWKEYSYTSQVVSELMAVNAPTRPTLIFFFTLHNIFVFAFGLQIYMCVNLKRKTSIAGGFLVLYSIIGQIALIFFPMHMRGAERTISDTMHIVSTIALSLILMLAMGLSSVTDGKWFKIYSIGTIIILLLFGAWAAPDGALLDANQPTPWFGIKERINIYATMFWIAIFASVLLKTNPTPEEH
jgi:hypothetical protein